MRGDRIKGRRAGALILALLCATARAQDAGIVDATAEEVILVKRATILTPSDQLVEVVGGGWLGDQKFVKAGKLAAGDREENKALKEAVPEQFTAGPVIVCVAIALTAFAAGVAVGHATK